MNTDETLDACERERAAAEARAVKAVAILTNEAAAFLTAIKGWAAELWDENIEMPDAVLAKYQALDKAIVGITKKATK
jgi:hypothetical protein